MEKQNRWKSKWLWAAVAAQTLSLLQLAGILEAVGLDAGKIGDVIAIALELLVTVGILNNPTDAKDW